jgi:DNA-directed RNA polymerase specialized sigma24 family protein
MARIEDRCFFRALQFEADLRAHLRPYASSADDEEELLQRVYAQLLLAGLTLSGNLRPLPELCIALCRNVVTALCRTTPSARWRYRPGNPARATGSNFEAPASNELARIESAARQLPAHALEILILLKVRRLTPEQISEELGLTRDFLELMATSAMRLFAHYLYATETTPHTREFS